MNSAPGSWLILADDLTGAADCGIAFAKRGLPAAVSWGDAHAASGEEPVQAVDADSRRLSPAKAAARNRALLEARHGAGTRLFKKIDSTLRGQPAAELAETVRVLRERGRGALAVVAPAFPTTGRTTEGGRIHLDGVPLEQTPLWARDHVYPSADLPAVLGAAGLRTVALPLSVIRAGAEALAAAVRDAGASGAAVVVCDAVLSADLDGVAVATWPLRDEVFWVGSGGLAAALAAATAGAPPPGSRNPPAPAQVAYRGGGVLLVIGSLAEASRTSAAALRIDGAVRHLSVDPDWLRAGPGNPGWRGAAALAAGALGAGEDVMVEIAATSGADPSHGAELAGCLGELLAEAAPRMGALFATGGETACALLSRLGVHGIRLLDEVEPGVPLGITRGALSIPVVTKAGAFGGPRTIRNCLARLRASLSSVTVPAATGAAAPETSDVAKHGAAALTQKDGT